MMRRLAMGAALGLAFTGILLMTPQIFGAEDKAPKDLQVRKNPVPLSDEVSAKAKKTYAENCLQCHGEKGKGDGPMAGLLKEPPADLSNTGVVAKITDGELFWTLTKGKAPVMPPFESKLTEDERWGLIHFLRDLSKTKPNNTPQAGH